MVKKGKMVKFGKLEKLEKLRTLGNCPDGWSFSIVALVVVLLVLIGGAGSVWANQTDAELIARYEPMWRSMFLAQNGFSVSEFAHQVTVKSRQIMRGQTATYFRVDFSAKIDWVELPLHHQFLIRLAAEDAAYRQTSLPRDTWFAEKDIEYVVAKRVYNTEMDGIRKVDRLGLPSLEEAKKEINFKTGIVTFFELRPGLYVPGKAPRVDGYPYLIFKGTRQPAPEPVHDPGDTPDFDLKGTPRPDLMKFQLESDRKKPRAFDLPAPGGSLVAPGVRGTPPSVEDPSYTGSAQTGSAPTSSTLPASSRSSETVRAPDDEEPERPETAAKVVVGYLNLVTKDLEFWEDTLIRY